MASNHVREQIWNEYSQSEKEIFESSKHGTWGDNINTTFDTKGCILREYNFHVLTDFITSQVLQYAKFTALRANRLKLAESWINYTDKYQYQEFHKHGSYPIAGVYYLKTNGKDGNIRFRCPIERYMFDVDNLHSHHNIEHPPVEGKLLLFPGWLEHSVRANLTDDTRISISFNFDWA